MRNKIPFVIALMIIPSFTLVLSVGAAIQGDWWFVGLAAPCIFMLGVVTVAYWRK